MTRAFGHVRQLTSELSHSTSLQVMSGFVAPSALAGGSYCMNALEHQQDVGALVVLHKAQIREVPHLARLRVPYRLLESDTKTVSTTD